MYTDKEKLNHFNDLLSSDKAQADLDLLVSLAPELEGLERFRMEPPRYAEEILFHLLDVATREQIRMNRRSPAPMVEAPVVKKEKEKKPDAPKAKAEKKTDEQKKST